MVQRKVANKLGIQADNVKSEKRLANLKPSSYQHQDGRNRGTDMKKKMKKSRSFKLSDIESLRSPPVKRNMAQPGKPPPLNAPTSAATPQKQPMIKTSDGSPNYMKSTSSSDARQERCQVSSRNTQTGSDGKNSSRRNSKHSKLDSPSGHKSARTLTRSSSLKRVRSLTKTPSFKLARSSSKKCSKVALCVDFNAHRATCSSTLKDSKFPAYLMLNPGGTESEGISVVKVCPYTYCSLNGHHHTPLPPLKCFLSARRRLLKTQKSMKLKAKLSDEETAASDTKKLFSDEQPALQEEDCGSSAISPLIQEGGMDFIIEIYAKNKEDTDETAETSGSITGNGDGEKIDFVEKMEDFNDFIALVGGGDETTAEYDCGQVAESLSDGSPCSEIDFEDNLDQNNEIIAMDIAETFFEVQKPEAAVEGYPTFLAQEETTPECLCDGSDWEEEYPASIKLDESASEASDMEWEEEQLTSSCLDSEADETIQTDDESDLNASYLSETENPDLPGESIFKSDDALRYCSEKGPANQVLQEVFEDCEHFEIKVGDKDSEFNSMSEKSDNEESSQASDSKNHDQLSSIEDAFEKPTTGEQEDCTAETDGLTDLVIASASMEEPIEGGTEESEEKKAVCNAGDVNEFLRDDDANVSHADQIADSSQDFTGPGTNATNEDGSQGHKVIEVCQLDGFPEEGELTKVLTDESLVSKTEDSETAEDVAADDFGLEQQLLSTEAGDGIDEEDQANDANSFVGIHISDSSQSCFEADWENTEENNNESCKIIEVCQDDTIAEESVLSQEPIDGRLHSEENHATDEQSQNSSIAENQNHPEDQGEAEKLKSSSSMDSEEQRDSELNKCTLAENSDGEIDKMEVENNTEPEAAETCIGANDSASQKSENAFFHTGTNTSQEANNTCNDLKGKLRCKRPIKDLEETRKFNPREPNYLPAQPDPEAEKVDLRHQMMDERKNTEEWMVDYALQQAVTKLAPARKRKVALLVEAFETVIPTSKCETHLRHSSAPFNHVRSIQACS